MPIRNIVNVRIEELRKARGLSQTEFAVALGMEEKKGRSTVNNWEQSLVQVKSDDLIRIAKAFSVSADYLLGLSDAATDDKGLQFVCDYTGLSAPAVAQLIQLKEANKASQHISELIRLFANDLAFSFYEIGEKSDAAVYAISETVPFFRLLDCKRDLELALFQYSELSREIGNSVSGAFDLLRELQEKINCAKEWRRVENGEHIETAED